MSRIITVPPYRQSDPSPGNGNRRWRVFVFIVIVACGAAQLATGRDLQTVLLTIAGLGLAGATVARWVTDDDSLPSLPALLARLAELGGQR